jgi:flavin-dependent dehydrogenase
MPHALTELNLAEVTRPAAEPGHEIRADVCVVGAGIAGLSAAIESARLYRDVVLVDSLPLIGGQMVHSLFGLFCGVFGNGPEYRQLTHGIFDDIFRDLGPAGDLHFQPGHTKTVYYNEVPLGRWLERTIRSLGVKTILGMVLLRADVTDARITGIELASRYGNVTIAADGFDASGDAALTWQAGLPAGFRSAPSTAPSKSSSRTWTTATSRTGARSTPCSPLVERSTGCCAAAGWPSSSPAGAPRC